jgi:Dyp-type peroxidase family
MSARTPNPANIQANILRGSSKWRSACYVFFRIDQNKQGSARAFLKEILDTGYVGTAASVFPDTPRVNINIAFSHGGLAQIKMPIDDASRYKRKFLMREQYIEPTEDDEKNVDSAFAKGMRSADLEDLWPTYADGAYQWRGVSEANDVKANAWWADDSDPRPWERLHKWPHLLVWISAVSDEDRMVALEAVRESIPDEGGMTEIGCQFAHAFDDDKEHFGFVDGVSQPAIEGFRPGNPGDGKISARGWQSLPVGEFILGYPDEGLGPAQRLDLAPLARDGTFLVYRKLRQDVAAFHEASAQMADRSDLSPTQIEEKMMGRHHDGTPLVVPPGAPDPPASPSLWNDFTYGNDLEGSGCPFASHVRRSNPRDDLHFEGRRVNRHRIIRRGMPYGERHDPENEEGDRKRGLIFIAFNARIEDQFEFIQRQWLNGGRTFRLGDDADPIAGNGEDIRIVINGEDPALHVQPVAFTQFLGGDYFFVPSISMLTLIASGE